MAALAALPPLSRAAFLLDLDGTLLDIAPTPDQVVVDPELPGHLRRLRALCGDALAIVTGRPVAQVDALLGDVPFAVAGEHGTAIRHAPGLAVETLALPVPPVSWREAAEDIVSRYPGALVEPKAHGLVLHFRGAPEAGPALRDALQGFLAEAPGLFVLMQAKMAWEIRPAGVDKGSAVRALMGRPPFAGRLPIFVGDDVTDEDGILAAQAMGGVGLFVPEVFGEANDVRRWIGTLSGR